MSSIEPTPALPSPSPEEALPKTNGLGLHIIGPQLSRLRLAIFIAIFAILGTALLLFSQATTTPIATAQAEQMILPAGASVISDSTASGSQAVKLTANGTLHGSVTLPSSTTATSLTLSAHGNSCHGWASLSLMVDGKVTIPTTATLTTSWKDYTATVNLTTGTHTLDITATNIGSKSGCTRNLYLDVTNLYGSTITPVPTVSLTALPTSVTVGASSTLNWSTNNATSCTASGSWSGPEPISGSAPTGALNATATYTLTCTGAGGSAYATATVGVANQSYQVPSTIAGDCSQDVTSALLSWIASVPNNSTLMFGSNQCYRIDSTLEIKGRIGLDIEGSGSKFDGHFAALNDQAAIWRIWQSSGMKLNNMTIAGPYTNGGTFTAAYQHAHAVDLRGTNADVGNITMYNLSGDCVYFGLGSDNITKSSGNLHDSSCSAIGRNGVSVTAGQNINVTHNTLDKIGYETFDVEPNVGSDWGASNLVFDTNTIKAYSLYGFSVVENAPISGVTFSNNSFVGKGLRAAAGNPGGQNFRPQHITIKGNSSDTAQAPAAMNLDNIDFLTVTGNTVPMNSGNMAGVDSGCSVNVSSNSYPGGSVEVNITNPVTSC